MTDYSKEIERFNASVEGKASLTYIVRDSDLQRNALAELSTLAKEVEGWKQRAISEQDENHANLFLGCECVIETLKAELTMWLQLKAGEPDDAWNSLIKAQTGARDAVRAHKGFSQLEARAIRLVNIERVVFPEQVYFSAGLIVEQKECSICGAEYDDCNHLVGMPYMGKFCNCILRSVKPDHVAIVKEPANKQCRVVNLNVEGGKRNRMTWRVEPTSIDNPDPEEKGLLVDGILLAMSDLGERRNNGRASDE